MLCGSEMVMIQGKASGTVGVMKMIKWWICIVVGLLISALGCCRSYNTYIVGDDVGWVAKFTNPINYTAWAANKTFSLGDTLVFNYVANHTVEQTNLFDTYLSCDPNDSNDTSIQYWSSEGSTQSVVPLTSTGVTYFLCSAFDGSHCLEGMRFPITVSYGQGLPPSAAPTAGSDGDESPDANSGFQLPPPPPHDADSPTNKATNHFKFPRLLRSLFFAAAVFFLAGALDTDLL